MPLIDSKCYETSCYVPSAFGNHDSGYEKRFGYNMLADAGLADRCDDINECLIDTDLCHSNGVCTNTDGSFQCGCGIGFQGLNFIINYQEVVYHKYRVTHIFMTILKFF